MAESGPAEYADYGYRSSAPSRTHEYLWEAVLGELAGRLDEGSSILDAGCGNGSFCKALAGRYDVCGFDLSDSGIRIAREICPSCDFRVASVYDDLRRLFNKEFAAVTSLEVIEHLYDPRKFLGQVRAALAPQGLLVLSTPYHGYIKNLAILASGKFEEHFDPLWDGGHIKFWSRRSIRMLLTECGFTPLTWRGVGRLPLVWKSMIAVARKS